MKTFAKIAIALTFAANLSACGALDGVVGDITIEPGCLIFCK